MPVAMLVEKINQRIYDNGNGFYQFFVHILSFI